MRKKDCPIVVEHKCCRNAWHELYLTVLCGTSVDTGVLPGQFTVRSALLCVTWFAGSRAAFDAHCCCVWLSGSDIALLYFTSTPELQCGILCVIAAMIAASALHFLPCRHKQSFGSHHLSTGLS